ncbi:MULTISPECIES: HPF/RaiA family ribosome-associated protein [unclassified Uliginosibacterium]|uniref:HPF/RaiA family ribosome-associated protein n=1 Tax=unclassified Uliginosibacterium TaxID=2621521 RepID=UPI000C7CB0F0|nr:MULTISPECIES: HPF/RaiA family ribosome-associated protein [unclassified Uliginosibacterium]MDO6385743.1 HPF/RaiA family ribosome-associated protein [Uliginosibacterium sp. 31-12]PLK49766.1 30S ribosomal protein S30 [Uliginosibacterium sp. TH139]
MHIDIQFRGIDVSQALREHAERRVRFTLGRLAGRIARVSISLVDINGPKGGDDKSCTVQISLQQPGSVVVEELGADLYQVLDRSLARAGRTVVRRLERQARQRYAARSERIPAEAELV